MDSNDLNLIKTLTSKRAKLLEQRKAIDDQLKAYETVLNDLSSSNSRRDRESLGTFKSTSASSSGDNGKDLSVKDIVLGYVSTLDSGFTRKQVMQYITANFPKKKPHENYIYTLFSRLENDGFIEIKKRGAGRKGNLYRYNFNEKVET